MPRCRSAPRFVAGGPSQGEYHDHALCDLLWADVAERQARQTLRQNLWLIREKFGDEVVVTAGGDVTLGDRVETDRDRFLEAASAGDWPRETASGAVKGYLLESCHYRLVKLN